MVKLMHLRREKEAPEPNVLTCFLVLKRVAPSIKGKVTKNFSATILVLCRNNFPGILKMSMSQSVSGLETHLRPTTFPD
jgi:hypothetical protein